MYWLESVVIGGFNVLKIIFNQGAPDDDFTIGNKPSSQVSGVKFILVPFFMVHYGIFMGVQGVFMGVYGQIGLWSRQFPPHLWWGLGAILLNHLIGLVYSYLYKGAYRRVQLGTLFFQPYPRVFVQQFVAIIGSFFMNVLNSHFGALLVFIVIKTIADFIGAALVAEKKA
jgi:hypothetical protein